MVLVQRASLLKAEDFFFALGPIRSSFLHERAFLLMLQAVLLMQVFNVDACSTCLLTENVFVVCSYRSFTC